MRHELEGGKQVRHELGRRASEAKVFTRGTEVTSETQIFTWGIGRRKHEARYSIIHLLRHVPHLSTDREMPHLSTRSASRRLSKNIVFWPEFFDEPHILLECSQNVFRSIKHNISAVNIRSSCIWSALLPNPEILDFERIFHLTRGYSEHLRSRRPKTAFLDS